MAAPPPRRGIPILFESSEWPGGGQRPGRVSAREEARAHVVEWQRLCYLAWRLEDSPRRPDGRHMSSAGDALSRRVNDDPRPALHQAFAVLAINGAPVAGTALPTWAYLGRPLEGGPWQLTLEQRPLSFLDLRPGEAACPVWAKNWVRQIQSRLETLTPGGRRRALALVGVAALLAAARGAGRAARIVFKTAANSVTSWLAAASTVAFAHGTSCRAHTTFADVGAATESDAAFLASPASPEEEDEFSEP